MRILMLSDLPPKSSIGSGAERFMTLLVDGLIGYGHDVNIKTFYRSSLDIEALVGYDIIHIHNYSMTTKEQQTDLIRKAKETPLIYTTHDYLYLCLRRHGLIPKGYPCPFFGQDMDICETCVPYGHRVIPGLFESARVIVADSVRMAEIYREHLPNSDVRSIQLGVPLSPTPNQNIDKTKNTFLYMGRHSVEKGYVEMIAAFKSLNTMCPDTRLVITHRRLGDDALRIIANRSGLAHKIEITGRVERVKLKTYLNKCVAVLAPSVWEEPFNLTITEAWQYGRPVIASRIGAHIELIERSNGGLLYEPYDIEGLALQMKTLYENPTLANELGVNGYNSIGQYFNQDRMIRDYIQLYEEVVQK